MLRVVEKSAQVLSVRRAEATETQVWRSPEPWERTPPVQSLRSAGRAAPHVSHRAGTSCGEGHFSPGAPV